MPNRAPRSSADNGMRISLRDPDVDTVVIAGKRGDLATEAPDPIPLGSAHPGFSTQIQAFSAEA